MHLYLFVDEARKTLYSIQDGFNLQLNSWSPRSMSLGFGNCRLIEPAGVQLFVVSGWKLESEPVVAGAVGKVNIPPLLRDFQAERESPAFGLFHGAAFSTALSPADIATEPFFVLQPHDV